MIIECLGSGSSGNCYVVEFENGDVILLDAGLPHKKIMKALGYRRLKLKGVLLTHEHADHSIAIKKFIEDGVAIYTSEGTARVLGIERAPRLHLLKHGTNITVGENISVTALNTVHNAEEPLMFTVIDKDTKESLIYLTDTSYVDFKFDRFNYYLVECNYMNDVAIDNRKHGIYSHSENHMSFQSTLKLLANSDLSNCMKIILLHLSENNANELQMLREVENATGKNVSIADKGKIWELSNTPF